MQINLTKFFLYIAVINLLTTLTINAQEGVFSINQDPQIDALLRLKKEVNKTAARYKIQIYSGNRLSAEKIRLEFRNYFSDWSTSIKYETPNYKIWIGNFNTRLEADRTLLKIKKKFGNAFIFKPKKEKE